ncbi:hypothetical protein POSPLADRAFT_1042364 [Postia placenta MAD-698-R-SB12]|uniref:UNC-45/Cro1/She4 central domain-containing protein n=1 Tax=Postia placenta MAD-698-R-SB12 TaxID=670580 RepID=A0A1X6NEQ0_9APHY|nr:hypothetical protein POSPLADRAFT_1042364 [Postia placenta MAD-698-R-SB12]OSX67091.1 hypothetical protein POSPLADRAFT_1042364 [Postia placenta MAD-698-R-SB12]
MSDDLEQQLNAIIGRSQEKTQLAMLPEELSTLINAFLPTEQPTSLRSKAYVALSALCQHYRNISSPAPAKQDTEEATLILHKTFSPPLSSRLSDTVEIEVLAGISFLSALFEVDWKTAAVIFEDEGTIDSVMDGLDMFYSSQISRAVAHLFSQACGHKSCRALISSQHVRWLETKSRQTSDPALRAAAAVALVKLSRGVETDSQEARVAGDRQALRQDDEALAQLMKGLVVDERDSSSLADAIEGLAYLSIDPSVKETLANDSSFLSRLFTVIPRRKPSLTQSPDDIARSPAYGFAIIVLNICAYRARLSDEEAQIAKLKRMTKASPTSSKPQDSENNPLDDDDRVRERGRKLIMAGVVDALTAAIRVTDSRAVRVAIGKILLHLVEDQGNRGKILQGGGAKALLLIIQSILPTPSATTQPPRDAPLDSSDIDPIQALAKLAITSSPIQVFGPNQGALYDAIRPFTIMLVNPASNLLQRFEALMALTNLTSQGEEVAARVARAEGLLNKVELLMLEDHTLVRRAATELICNLAGGCEEVFNRYGGEASAASKSKLQVLVALCDVDDVPTQLAASGAVAILTSSPDACQSLLELQEERHKVLPILGQLIDPAVMSTTSESRSPGSCAGGRSDRSGASHCGRAEVLTRRITCLEAIS